jgi:hypothetical protein
VLLTAAHIEARCGSPLTIVSYLGENSDNIVAGASSRSLQTSLQLNSQTVFKAYSHAGVSASDVTINLKDLKALLGLCLELGADVSLKFDKAGLPLLAVPHLRGAQVGAACGWWIMNAVQRRHACSAALLVQFCETSLVLLPALSAIQADTC